MPKVLHHQQTRAASSASRREAMAHAMGNRASCGRELVIPYGNQQVLVSSRSQTGRDRVAVAMQNRYVPEDCHCGECPDCPECPTLSLRVWVRVAGDGLNTGWAGSTFEVVYALTEFNDKLYAGIGESTAGDAEVWEYDPTTNLWTKVGGDGVNSSWNTNYESVFSLAVCNSKLYAGLGISTGDAEVWEYSAGSWTKVGGDGVNSSWSGHTHVFSMVAAGTDLYAALGDVSGDAEVWRYRAGAWTQIGGDSLNSGWGAGYERVGALKYNASDGSLFAGLGTTAGDAEVWSFNTNTTTWTKIGGDALNSSWAVATYENVHALEIFDGHLYAGLGSTVGDAEVWKWDGPTVTWTKVGGDGVNSSWATATYERVNTLCAHGGKLYAGLGADINDGEVWEYDGSAWARVGGIGLNSSWNLEIERVQSSVSFAGRLYVGLGTSTGDAEVWGFFNIPASE